MTATLPMFTPTGASPLLPTYKRAPVEFVDGDGVYLIDVNGRRYLDLVAGIAVNALGHGDPGLREVMHEAADGLIHVSNLYQSEPGLRLAQKLVDASFASHVFFGNSGAEAIEGAFKFARRWARKQGESKHEIIAFRGGFHGRLFASLAATDRPAYRRPFRPLTPGIAICERDLNDLAAMVDRETTAAIILEPVQGEGGVRVFDRGFLAEVRALATEREVALIFDEVQCGLGRLGTLFAYEHFGVVPDMLTLAKPLAGGLPMGAILVNETIASAIEAGDHGSTFGGGLFVSSVASYVFSRLSEPSMLEHVRSTGEWLGGELRRLTGETDRIRAVRGLGFIWGIDTVRPAAEIVAAALDAGLLVCTAGDHTVRLLPPLVATREELSAGVRLLREVLCS